LLHSTAKKMQRELYQKYCNNTALKAQQEKHLYRLIFLHFISALAL